MISQRVRESRRVRALKMPKNIERLYKEGKCRDCAVVVTRMDFAKILGKFTKVKIQYESCSTPKTKKTTEVPSPNSNTRLKRNENGMVLIHRNAYSQHPVKELLNNKKPKTSVSQPVTPKQTNNILKENNRLKKTPAVKDKNSNINISSSNESKKKNNNSQLKQYGIIFIDPTSNNNNEFKNKTTLNDLLPLLDKTILPNRDWSYDYLPRNAEPTNDKVYDRIAAELEDLMYNEKPSLKSAEKDQHTETKVDDFPSIMDILNDNSNDSSKPNNQNATNLESSDVEAMLLGKSDTTNKTLVSNSMDVDNADMSNLIADVAQLNAIQVATSDQDNVMKTLPIVEEIDNPHSPSILDEALQKGIEEHLPCDPSLNSENTDNKTESQNKVINNDVPTEGVNSNNTSKNLQTNSNSEEINNKPDINSQEISFPPNVSHLIFKKHVNGECVKCVTCPKNLKYNVELEGKSVEFLGAPKFITSLEDLKVLLQIVNETELEHLYVCQ
ncbi:unnamed protein product [Diatraea saccharalis]|uniref:Uncharacterized protein n=1 Tax=Diatraea saccharalis TaxID=40085 RepID=A0A9N9R1J9_9NEOP|nr:unnamed protein product [Diatraea saccharalis]